MITMKKIFLMLGLTISINEQKISIYQFVSGIKSIS